MEPKIGREERIDRDEAKQRLLLSRVSLRRRRTEPPNGDKWLFEVRCRFHAGPLSARPKAVVIDPGRTAADAG